MTRATHQAWLSWVGVDPTRDGRESQGSACAGDLLTLALPQQRGVRIGVRLDLGLPLTHLGCALGLGVRCDGHSLAPFPLTGLALERTQVLALSVTLGVGGVRWHL